VTDEQKDLLREAYQAKKAPIYGDAWNVQAVQKVVARYVRGLLEDVVRHINAIKPDDLPEAVLCPGAETLGGDIVAWRGGVCDGVRECDCYDSGIRAWYWRYPGHPQKAHQHKNPIECLIGMVEDLEALHEGQVS